MLELLMTRIVLEGWQILTVDNKAITWEGGVKPKGWTPEGREMKGTRELSTGQQLG